MNKFISDYFNKPITDLWKNKDFARSACGIVNSCNSNNAIISSGLSDSMVYSNNISSISINLTGCTVDSIILVTAKDDGNGASGSWGPLSVLPGLDHFDIVSGINIAGIADTRQVYWYLVKL